MNTWSQFAFGQWVRSVWEGYGLIWLVPAVTELRAYGDNAAAEAWDIPTRMRCR